MNLSRAAKKFRAEMPTEPKALKPVQERKLQQKLKAQAQQAAPEPVPEAAPQIEAVTPVEVVEEPALAAGPCPEPVDIDPTEPAAPPAPKKAWRVKVKRARFVREQAERRERPQTPALPSRSTKLTARMMTQNLAVPPKDDDAKLPR